MTAIENLAGNKYGRLTVQDSYIRRGSRGRIHWEVVCECGNKKHIDRSDLVTGHTTSCGCYRKEVTRKTATTHGKSKTRLYRTWAAIIDRCYNSKDKYYHIYGGKGVRIYDKWRKDFMCFHDYVSDAMGFIGGLSIDRIDPEGDYRPGNIRWANNTQQNTNKAKRNRRCSSKYKGVSWCSRNSKWVAAASSPGRKKHLGYFDSETDAAKAYNNAARDYFGEFARLNEISE